MDDIVLNKKESIEHCVKQIRTYYKQPSEAPFKDDHLIQDAIALNLQRACEQCIDLANHTIRARKLGLPKESRESFRLLAQVVINHTKGHSKLANSNKQRFSPIVCNGWSMSFIRMQTSSDWLWISGNKNPKLYQIPGSKR